MSIDTSALEKIHKRNKWEIKIPKIGLIASISNGTTSEILDNYVGHFEETGITSGNIGLAAHNRGYQNNYFAKIKELKKGDVINYIAYGTSKSFIIIDLLIIEDDNWEVLSESPTTMLTLITCLEDRPHYRRCVKAIEI